MRSPGKGVLSATTQVKVSSPEIFLFALGQGFHVLEASIGMPAIGEGMSDVPGSESVAGKRTDCIGTWEDRSVPYVSRRGVEETTRRYGVSVFGPTHSRGVGGVMPVGAECPLEGVGGLTRRDGFRHAEL